MARNRRHWYYIAQTFAGACAAVVVGGLCVIQGAELMAGVDPLRPHPYSLSKALDQPPTDAERPTVKRLTPPPTPDDDLGSQVNGGFNDTEKPQHPLSSFDTSCAGYEGCQPRATWLQNSSLFVIFDSFQNQLRPAPGAVSSSVGSRVGGYTAVSVWDPAGISLEGGGSAGWYEYRGTPFRGVDSRFQNFWTAAFAQRLFEDQFAWGFAHDWLYDNVFNAGIHLEQWRTKLAWQCQPSDQFGLWVSVAERGMTVNGPNFLQPQRYRPFTQGVAYWQHEWHASIATQLYVGKAAPPGDWSFGGSAQVPLNEFLALYANGLYVLPHREPFGPGTGEVWNMSLGLTFYPGSAMRGHSLAQRPLFNMADNANMTIRTF